MAELFVSTDVLKAAVGGTANQSLEIESIAPTIYDTARKYITPWLGDELYEALVADYEDADGDPNDMEAELAALLPYVQLSLGRLAMYEYGKVGSIMFSESGRVRIESENAKSAFRYQEAAYDAYMLEHGHEALERCLIFLAANEDDYPDWTDSGAADKYWGVFLNTAKAFRMVYSKRVDRYTFECLRPLIEDLEQFVVDGNLPAAFLADLREKWRDGTATTAQKKVVLLIQRVIAHLAIEFGIERFWVKLDGDAVRYAEHTGDQARAELKTASSLMASLKMRHHDIWANNHMAGLRKFLLDNKADFPRAFCEDDGGTNTDNDAWCPTADAAAEEEETTDCGCERDNGYSWPTGYGTNGCVPCQSKSTSGAIRAV